MINMKVGNARQLDIVNTLCVSLIFYI